MTDTMRDWYNKRFANRNPDLCEHGYEDMLEAWQAAQADAQAERENARALVGELVEETLPLYEYADNYYKERGLEVKKQALTKAQAFMEGKV